MILAKGVKIIILTAVWFAISALMERTFGREVIVHEVGFMALGMIIYGLVD